MKEESKRRNFIKFLGTAGARFVVITQLRSSAGFIINVDETRVHVDPGPGAIVKLNSSRPKLNPSHTDCVLISHRHLDHTNDVNVIIEGMTEGGLKQKGMLVSPRDCLEEDPVVFKYVRDYIDKIEMLEMGKRINVKNLEIYPAFPLNHGVENYAIMFRWKNGSILYISDTKYFEMPLNENPCDVMIINMVLMERRDGIMHLSVKDAEEIIKSGNARVFILTHFGMHVIKNKPWVIAEELSRKTGKRVLAASDGMEVNLDEIIGNSS